MASKKAFVVHVTNNVPSGIRQPNLEGIQVLWCQQPKTLRMDVNVASKRIKWLYNVQRLVCQELLYHTGGQGSVAQALQDGTFVRSKIDLRVRELRYCCYLVGRGSFGEYIVSGHVGGMCVVKAN